MDEHSTNNGKSPTVEFNFDDFTGEDFEDFNEALLKGKNRTASEFYAKMVVRCPAEWGDPTKPETYYKLPYLKFRNLIKLFQEAVGEDTKN